jgi:1-acyl-sn-glycerol-3-phosphate acyltransferase
MKTVILYIRSTLFLCIAVPVMLLFPAIGALISFLLSNRARHAFITLPAPIINVLLRLICGIKIEVSGRENIPNGNFVVLAKHQSDWETYYLHRLFRPVSTILKKELLKIPFFGWGLACVQPIPIDRDNPRQAIKQIMTQGQLRLADGNNVVIYPEGTRVKFGQKGKYARSGANLAIAAGVPILLVSHNAGVCWPGKKFLKYPGTIKVVIGKPIDTANVNSKELTNQAEEWIEAQQVKFIAEQ